MKARKSLILTACLTLGLALFPALCAGAWAAETPTLDARWSRAVLDFGDATVLLARGSNGANARLIDHRGVERLWLQDGNQPSFHYSQVNGEQVYFNRPASAGQGPEWLATQAYLLWRDLATEGRSEARRGGNGPELRELEGFVRAARPASVSLPLSLVSTEITADGFTLLAQREATPMLREGEAAFAAITARMFDAEGGRLGIARWFDVPRVFTWGFWGATSSFISEAQSPGELPSRGSLLWSADQLLMRYTATPECVIGPCPPFPPGPGWPPSGDDCENSPPLWCPPTCFSCTGPYI